MIKGQPQRFVRGHAIRVYELPRRSWAVRDEAPPGAKWCARCQTYKSEEGGFYRDPTRAGGFASECKECMKERSRTGSRGRHLMRAYGITEEEYLALVRAQRGRCAICRIKPDPNGTHNTSKLHVDHDERTGVIRGLLCGSCNRAIGLLKHNRRLIKQAYLYLAR